MHSSVCDSGTAENLKSEKLVEDIFADLKPCNEANIECYTKHAEKYDEGFCGLQFENPQRLAIMALKHLKTSSVDKLALDICAGEFGDAKPLRLEILDSPVSRYPI